MREEVQQALDTFRDGMRHLNWYGKTRRQFWEWFGVQKAALRAMVTDDPDREALAAELLELTALADDMGYVAPPEMDDVTVERPAPLDGGRENLNRYLENLRQAMPAILALPASEQMDAFAGIAEGIEEATGQADRSYVSSQLQCILRDAGLIPGDDEPCAD